MMIIYDCFSGYISAFLCLLLCQLRTIGQPVTFTIVGSFSDSSAFCFGECAFMGGLTNAVRRKMDRRLDEACMGDDMSDDFTYFKVNYCGLRFNYYMFDYQVPAVQSFKSSSKNFISKKLCSRFWLSPRLTNNRVLKLSRRILNKHYVRTNIDQISICSRWGRKLNVRGNSHCHHHWPSATFNNFPSSQCCARSKRRKSNQKCINMESMRSSLCNIGLQSANRYDEFPRASW